MKIPLKTFKTLPITHLNNAWVEFKTAHPIRSTTIALYLTRKKALVSMEEIALLILTQETEQTAKCYLVSRMNKDDPDRNNDIVNQHTNE